MKLLIKKILSLPANIIQKRTSFAHQKLNLQCTKSPKNKKDYLANWLIFIFGVAERVRCHIWMGKANDTYKDLTSNGPLFKIQLSKILKKT